MDEILVYEGDTALNHYQIYDMIYSGRPARVLYSGNRQAAQSGVARDGKAELLFDYNERLMELSRALQPKKVLLIGGGALTLPIALMAERPDLLLDVVELDPGLIHIAGEYFGFKPVHGLNIHIEDGLKHLKYSRQHYDLIIMDAFSNAAIPPGLHTKLAGKLMAKRLTADGVLAINIISGYYGERAAALRRQIKALRKTFTDLQLFPAGQEPSLWLPQNFILIAHNQARDLSKALRYAALELPPTS